MTKEFIGTGGTGKQIEAALLAFFFKEYEGTMEEFYFTFRKVEVTPRQRTEFERAMQRLQRKGVLEPIGYLGRWMNYRVTETALTKGLTTKRRGSYGIKQNIGDGIGSEPRGDRKESSGLRR